MSCVDYQNEFPVECLTGAWGIYSSGEYEQRKAEFGKHIYGLAVYGLSQLSQAHFGTVESVMLGECCPDEEQCDQADKLCSFLKDLPEEESQNFAAAAEDDNFKIDPALVAVLIQLAVQAIQAWLKRRNPS